MRRREFIPLIAAGCAACYGSAAPVQAGVFTGKIRKSLKWGMVQQAKQLSLQESFEKLRECGFEGVEPSLSQVAEEQVAEWTSASEQAGLVIDGTVGGRLGNLEAGIELTRRLGGDSMLVVVGYDQQRPLPIQWNEARDRLRAAAPAAEKQGIKLLVENVWASFLISPFDMARFIDEVDSPWVQVQLDLGNMLRWGVAEHWVDVIGSRAQKLDIKEFSLPKAMNEGLRLGFDVPLGEGSIQWSAVREALQKIEYRGWAAAEVRGGDWAYLTDVARRMGDVLDI